MSAIEAGAKISRNAGRNRVEGITKYEAYIGVVVVVVDIGRQPAPHRSEVVKTP